MFQRSMTTHLLLAGLALICFHQTGMAEQMAARGVGGTSCAKFAELYRGQPEFTNTVYASWAQGFMSGWNFSTMAEHKTHRELGAQSAETQMAYIRNYCDSHPLAPFLKAVLDFYLTLPVRKD
jgi:hypothetical protein